MEFTYTCPDCGKEHTLQLEVHETATPPQNSVKVTRFHSETIELNWHEIAKDIKSGNTMLKVGDEINCCLNDGNSTPVTSVVAHKFDDGTVAFVLKDRMASRMYMNESSTNKGGYAESAMRKYLDGKVFELLPDDLKEVIKPRLIKQHFDSEEYSAECKLWLPSITEIEGDNWAESDDASEVQFDLFKDEKSRVKQFEGKTTGWWARSPYTGSSTGFVNVYTNGSSYYNGASLSYGVAFGFLI